MSQIVKIECQSCEEVQTYELEHCLLIGELGGKFLILRHEMETVEALHALVDYLVAEGKEEEANDGGKP